MFTIFHGFLALLSFGCILAGSLAGLYNTIWGSRSIPYATSLTSAIFSLSMLCFTMSLDTPAPVILFTVATVCWGTVLTDRWLNATQTLGDNQ